MKEAYRGEAIGLDSSSLVDCNAMILTCNKCGDCLIDDQHCRKHTPERCTSQC